MSKPPITEARLETLRDDAARTGFTPPTPANASYHGNPVLKPPTWTWEVPLYLFIGGASGAAAVIAVVAYFAGELAVTRAAMWIALGGAFLSPPLLISDLGRPARFLYMLRVFKWRSAMSVGVWTLVAFSSAVAVAALCRELTVAGITISFVTQLEPITLVFSALFGMLLASYTSVLLSVTAVPVWSENRRRLPIIFVAGGLGSASAVLELLGFIIPVTQTLGLVASAIEAVMALVLEFRKRPVDRPLREGASGQLLRIAALLSGLVPLVLRIGWSTSSDARYIAAISFLAGALVTRYGWLLAGRASSRDPQALFAIQRK